MNSRVLALCSLVFLVAVGLRTPVSGASSFKLGTASGSSGDPVSVPLLLSSTQDVQGVVAAFDWDGTKLEGANLTAGAVLATADTVVRRTQPSYMVLGVVEDSNPSDGNEIIPAGNDIVLATAGLKII